MNKNDDRFITNKSSFIISPVTIDNFGRYRCTATNSFGSTSSYVTIDSTPGNDENYDSIVYAYMDNYNFSQISHLSLKNYVNNQIKVINNDRNFILNKSVSLDCLAGNEFNILKYEKKEKTKLIFFF